MAKNDLIIVGTRATGFYVIREGSDERLSPVYSSRGFARSWLLEHRAEHERKD